MHLFIAEIYVFSLDEVDWKTNAYNVFLVNFFIFPYSIKHLTRS